MLCLSLGACSGGGDSEEDEDNQGSEEVVETIEYKIIVDVASEEDSLFGLVTTLQKDLNALFPDPNTSVAIYKASDVLSADMSIEEVLKSGEYDIGIVSPSSLKADNPWLAMLDSWFLFTHYEHYRMVWEDRVGTSMKRELSNTSGLNIVDALFEDSRVVLTSQETTLASEEDFKALNMGVKTSELSILQAQTMGVSVLPIVQKDLYRNLTEGKIDTFEDYLLNIKDERAYELCKTLALTHHQYDYSLLVVSDRLVSAVDEEHKTAYDSAIETFVDNYDQVSINARDEDLTFFKDLGINIQSIDRVAFHNKFSNFYRGNAAYTNLWNIEYYERILRIAIYLQNQAD